jgi:hypothetical protein
MRPLVDFHARDNLRIPASIGVKDFFTGMRFSEQIALTGAALHIHEGTLSVNNTPRGGPLEVLDAYSPRL